MREYAFELALCAHLEGRTDWLVSRQLGGGVADPGGRIVDVVGVEPGPAFDDRAAITSETIPPLAVESRVGVGAAVEPARAFDCSSPVARRTAERAVDVGFFEAERRGTRRLVRRATRYPERWFSRLVAIENKPDLGTPGELSRQLRTDASLALFDSVVLATESYVTRAHLNRLPPEVGVWRFHPDAVDGDGDDAADGGADEAHGGDARLEVVREPTPLPTTEPGVELLEQRPLRTDVALVGADEKARVRRRVAERAYGKGWRPDPPGCVHADVTEDGRPRCAHFDRVVDPAADCGTDCAAFSPADPPAVDRAALRDERTPWRREPDGVTRRQAGLDRFG